MANRGYGNFAFMYSINRDIYEQLSKAERNARIDFQDTGNPIRKALELFAADLIDTHNLSAFIPAELELAEKLRLLNHAQTLQDAGYLAPGQPIWQKPLLPYNAYNRNLGRYNDEVQYTVTASDNQAGYEMKSGSYYYFLRKFGNAFSHAGELDGEPEKNFENLCKALRVFHKILIKAYHVPGVPPFSVNKMPIGEFIVDSTMEPADQELSGCMMEFSAHTVDHNGEPEFYALLRQYPRDSLDANFMRRNRDCFVEAAKSSISSVPDGMTRMRELTDRTADNEFYIIAYIFNRKASILDNDILQQMDRSQRLDLCKRLLVGMEGLHSTENPIYHRLLNPTCIYVSKYKNIWVPYIVKLDYAKIEMAVDGRLLTVRQYAQKANEGLAAQNMLQRYIPREWNGKNSESTDIDWGKVDTFSLGVLLLDIRFGKFTPLAPGLLFEELYNRGESEELLHVLDRMCKESPADRSTVIEALRSFEKEVR